MCPRWDSNPHWTLFESAASAVGLRGRGRPHVGADTPIGPAYPGSLEAPQPVRSRRLPVTQQVSAQSEHVAPAGPGAGVRVMVVEDEALIRLDLAEMLTEEGYVVAGEAGDGDAAITMARQLRPELVIMDVKMPKVDGIAAAATIVDERIAPVVMLTAFSQRELI